MNEYMQSPTLVTRKFHLWSTTYCTKLWPLEYSSFSEVFCLCCQNVTAASRWAGEKSLRVWLKWQKKETVARVMSFNPTVGIIFIVALWWCGKCLSPVWQVTNLLSIILDYSQKQLNDRSRFSNHECEGNETQIHVLTERLGAAMGGVICM